MRRVEVKLASGSTLGAVRLAVQSSARALGLIVRSYTTLQSYPGSHHWHLARPDATGTLEITFWPRENRLWLSLQKERSTPWVRRSSRGMAAHLARSLGRSNGRTGKSSDADSRD